MPVVINEFEIVAEPPAQQPVQAPSAGQGTPVPSPHDLVQILRHQAERAVRVRAD
jgi:hypothetical protein